MHTTPYCGNAVEQYHYRTETCPECDKGRVPIDWDDAHFTIYQAAWGLAPFSPIWKILLGIYCLWKKRHGVNLKDGTMDCPECRGDYRGEVKF